MICDVPKQKPFNAGDVFRIVLLTLIFFLATTWLSQQQQVTDNTVMDPFAEDIPPEKAIIEVPQEMVRMMIQAVEELPQAIRAVENNSDEQPKSESVVAQAAPMQPSVASETPAVDVPGELVPQPLTGSSPEIQGSFDVAVLDYLSAVERHAGGRLIIWDKASKRAVGEVIEGTFKPTATLSNYSNRARDLTQDLPFEFRNTVLRELSEHYPIGIWRFVLVIPVPAEAQFEAAITKILHRVDLDWNSVDVLRLRYGLTGGHVEAEILSAAIKGRELTINQSTTLW